MQFKEGIGWKACYDEERELYTAETGGLGAYDLFEINKEIYERIGTEELSDSDSERLIHSGRHLYMDVNDRCGPPYTVVLDDEYRELCPWAKVKSSGPVMDTDLTDEAVEIFASEAKNREQRRRKKKEREARMKFDEMLEKVRKTAEKADVSNIDFLAVQVNITGDNSGVFYVEVKDHKISVEPYEYNDRNCAISMGMDDFNKRLDGKLDPVMAFTLGKLKVDGDVGKALEFSKLLK